MKDTGYRIQDTGVSKFTDLKAWQISHQLVFYRIAAGSVTEVQNQILISRDVGYLSNQVFLSLAAKTQDSIKLINGLIKSTLKTQNPESKILNPEDNKEDNSNSKEPSDE